MNLAQEENKQVIAALDNVVPFPSREAWEENKKEREEQRKLGIERTNALLPFLRIWLKRMLGRDAKQAFRDGKKWSNTFTIKWLITELLHPNTIASFTKDLVRDKIPVPELPEQVTSWEMMKAFMQAIRRYNYGMEKGASGYTILCHSDHKQVQTLSTGDTTWSEPTQLTFELWAVVNGDYGQPWKMEWVQDPSDPAKRIEVKVYTKTASVLKQWEDREEPVLEADVERNLKLLEMQEGDSIVFNLAGEVEDDFNADFISLGNLTSNIEEKANTRFYTERLNNREVRVYHAGKLYR